MEPFFKKDPWTVALTGKKVLVIHPFEESIRSQYNNKKHLFGDPRILPDFHLKTLKAIQSSASAKTDFSNWFEALEHMQEQTRSIDFDVAIIGCGAYGFPLAAFVKKLGKKAVHIGGSVQVLFGIKGRRWEEHPRIPSLFNEYWVRPLPSETPENFAL
jgi:hypothetical protein